VLATRADTLDLSKDALGEAVGRGLCGIAGCANDDSGGTLRG
jgi:hypothetical protein